MFIYHLLNVCFIFFAKVSLGNFVYLKQINF